MVEIAVKALATIMILSGVIAGALAAYDMGSDYELPSWGPSTIVSCVITAAVSATLIIIILIWS